MNYAELVQALQDYLQTTESSFVTNIPVFVRQAEERIYRDVTIPAMRKIATGTLTADSPALTKPSDLISTSSLRVHTPWDADSPSEVFLLPKDQTFLREAHPIEDTTSRPLYYADKDDLEWIVAPTPDENYPYTLSYEYDPESIVTASTTWLGDNAESALLYGALVEAYTYLKGDSDLIALYETRYQAGLDSLGRYGVQRVRRDDYRNNERRSVA